MASKVLSLILVWWFTAGQQNKDVFSGTQQKPVPLTVYSTPALLLLLLLCILMFTVNMG